MVVEMVLVVSSKQFAKMTTVGNTTGVSNTQELGLLLYNQYVYPFELAAAILLLAIVAAIALTHRRRKDSRYMDPAAQVGVKASERIKIIKMPAERDL
jgi:NADH-quinone oxidoreductase subunit J